MLTGNAHPGCHQGAALTENKPTTIHENYPLKFQENYQLNSKLTLTKAKLTEGGSSDEGVAASCDWLSGMVPMALILGLYGEEG